MDTRRFWSNLDDVIMSLRNANYKKINRRNELTRGKQKSNVFKSNLNMFPDRNWIHELILMIIH